MDKRHSWIRFHAQKLHNIYDKDPKKTWVARQLPIDDYWDDFINLKSGDYVDNAETELDHLWTYTNE